MALEKSKRYWNAKYSFFSFSFYIGLTSHLRMLKISWDSYFTGSMSFPSVLPSWCFASTHSSFYHSFIKPLSYQNMKFLYQCLNLLISYKYKCFWKRQYKEPTKIAGKRDKRLYYVLTGMFFNRKILRKEGAQDNWGPETERKKGKHLLEAKHLL